MCSSIIAHLRAIDSPKPLRIMTKDRVEQKNLHKTTQLEDGEHTKKQRYEVTDLDRSDELGDDSLKSRQGVNNGCVIDAEGDSEIPRSGKPCAGHRENVLFLQG